MNEAIPLSGGKNRTVKAHSSTGAANPLKFETVGSERCAKSPKVRPSSRFAAGHADAAVVGRPAAIAEERRRREFGSQAVEFRVGGVRQCRQETAAKHAEPVSEAAFALLKRRGTVEEVGEGDLQPVGFQ